MMIDYVPVKNVQNTQKSSGKLFQKNDKTIYEQNKRNALSVIYKRITAFQFDEALRLLNEFKQKFQFDIEYQFLHYHVVSLVQSEDAKNKRQSVAREILSTTAFMEARVEFVAKLWKQNTDLMESLSANQLRLIAYKLCDAKDLSLSEELIEFLLTHYPCPSNAKLLQRIAKRFALNEQQDKRLKYVELFNVVSSQVR